jgi:hypothetical protein
VFVLFLVGTQTSTNAASSTGASHTHSASATFATTAAFVLALPAFVATARLANAAGRWGGTAKPAA